jgi:orotidine-5'-phosphate decarboxylase
MMENFADRLESAIKKQHSVIVAGFDPVIENLPEFIKKEKGNKNALIAFHRIALEAIDSQVAGIKINTAFFEQYGLEGIEALEIIANEAKKAGILLIADAKRGDIGSTAKAYSNAFLGKDCPFDALTVSPFLGFDTLEVFLEDCIKNSKGIFVLVKTSNPGSSDIQGIKDKDGRSISDMIAAWVDKNAGKLIGKCGYSGLGAVVGATYPEEAVHLRKIMKTNFFLIPGYGAQGGSAKDAIAGFSNENPRGAAIINISRGLFTGFKSNPSNAAELKAAIQEKLKHFNNDINSNL